MDKVTQINSAHAEQSAAAALELKSEAQALEEAINKMKQLLNGTSPVAKTETVVSSDAPLPPGARMLTMPSPDTNDRSKTATRKRLKDRTFA